MYVCVQQTTQQQSSLVSATHYFMFQAEYHYKSPIDHAATNAAELMTKTTNAILGPVTGSGCFCSHFRGVCEQLGQQACASFRNQAGIITAPPSPDPSFSFSVVANTFSGVNRCQITPQLVRRTSLHDYAVCFCYKRVW